MNSSIVTALRRTLKLTIAIVHASMRVHMKAFRIQVNSHLRLSNAETGPNYRCETSTKRPIEGGAVVVPATDDERINSPGQLVTSPKARLRRARAFSTVEDAHPPWRNAR